MQKKKRQLQNDCVCFLKHLIKARYKNQFLQTQLCFHSQALFGKFKTVFHIIRKQLPFTVQDPFKLMKFKFQFSQLNVQKTQFSIKIYFFLDKYENDYIKA